VSAASHLQWTVCKTSGRLRAGQVIDCELAAALDDHAPVPGRALVGVAGPQRYYARVLAVPRVPAEHTVRALSVLGHPNVVGPIGVGGVDGAVFVVQELPEGESLDRMVQRTRTTGVRLTLREVEQVIRQVVTALRHAHQAQIRHGSLSSSHVRVARQASGELHVQVIDFGLLPLLAAHAPAVAVHDWHQLSPEQAASPAGATVASDLFALGVLLAETLTGHALVPPGDKMPWRELAVARPPEVRATVARERPETPDAVLDLVASLLRARPDDRAPATAMDLARLLPRLTWEPRAAPEIAEAPSRATPRAEAPPGGPPQAATVAPSRSFVVSGASYSVPAPAPKLAVPAPPARAPFTFDDPTMSEATPQSVLALMRAHEEQASARSWFAHEETVVTPSREDTDSAHAALEDAPADGTVVAPMPQRAARPAAKGFFFEEGTAVLAHPDQLAAPRDESTTWEGTRMLEAPPPEVILPTHEDEHTQPVPPVAAPVVQPVAQPLNLPFAIESTMPDTALPEAMRASLAAMGPPPRASRPMPSPSPARIDESGAHPALIVMVVVAAGAVLGLVLWGMLQR
jgi:serine/threonine-protein kinase